MDDRVIDLSEYLGDRGEGDGETFGVYGAEGAGDRFALPVWRAVYLLDGERGGIVRVDPSTDRLEPVFVLDLRADPPRKEFSSATVEPLRAAEPPTVHVGDGGISVLLGRTPEWSAYLVVLGDDVAPAAANAGNRENLLFLAGECAGLLRWRE